MENIAFKNSNRGICKSADSSTTASAVVVAMEINPSEKYPPPCLWECLHASGEHTFLFLLSLHNITRWKHSFTAGFY